MITYHCNQCNNDVEQSTCPTCKQRATINSQLYWCEKCNIPIYEDTCPLCGHTGYPLTSDVRPVFPEERLLIEIIRGKPFEFKKDSVWNGTGNRYYVNGKPIPFSISNLRKLDAVDIRNKLTSLQSDNSYEHFNEYISRWVAANSKRFNYLTTEAKQFIIEEAKRYLPEQRLFVSFSGGKDSTVVSDLVRRALSIPSIIHIFGDTTLEFPYTYEYIKRFKATNRKTPVLAAKNDQQEFFNLCNVFGPPSQTLRWCCTTFKTGYIGDKIRRTFGDSKPILTFYGIRRNESKSRSNYERESTGQKISIQHVASPIIDWMDYDIWLYLLTTGIDFNYAYRLGYTRVGCWCCPNNSNWSQFMSSVYLPEQTARFHDMLMQFATKMGKSDPEEYVSSGGWKARKGGAGIELSKNVAIEFKPCAIDAKSFNYSLNKPISKDLYQFFKPFGILNFDMGNPRLGEVFVLDCKTNNPIMKLQGRIGSKELRISILNTPIAQRTKTVEIELKFKCQITKFQLCTGCHACETICPRHAIRLVKIGDADTDYRYEIDDSKCIHCFECINHYTGGCYMRRVLLPRGKGYVKNG